MARQAKAHSAKRPVGRPTKYTDAIATEICERLSRGEPLTSICSAAHMPATRTVSDWKKASETFSAEFARARDDGFDALAEECLAIADDTSGDDKWGGENGETRQANSEWISRSKLRVETRLKLLAKWDPKRYGERLDANLNMSGGVTINVKRFTPEPDAS